MTQFFRVVLRTLGVEPARAFYAAVFCSRADPRASTFCSEARADAGFSIVQLHEQAVARGARPHWLGLLEVLDVDQATALFVQRGAVTLGPKWVNPEGLEAAPLRDPGGAVLALAKPPALPSGQPAEDGRASAAEVGWYSLNTNDVERAKVNYAELFGWDFREPISLGELGSIHPFAFQRGGPLVGSLNDISGRPGVHPHWLFHFRVAALEPVLHRVRAAGGTVIGPLMVPGHGRVAVCDDPQGAAFGLVEARASAREQNFEALS